MKRIHRISFYVILFIITLSATTMRLYSKSFYRRIILPCRQIILRVKTMQYIKRPTLNNTTKLTMTSVLASLAVALRLFKHLIIGPIQIINLPGVMTVASGILMGAVSGFTVGLFAFFVSDLILGFGPWTPVTAGFMAFIGIVAGLLWFKRERIPRLELFTVSFILIFVNDVFTSVGGYMILGLSFEAALMTSLIGLFMPAGGGFFLAVGPITEGATAFLIAVLTPTIRKYSVEVNREWGQQLHRNHG